MRFDVTLDNEPTAGDAEARVTLARWLRDRGKTGVHEGCDTSACGACTVLVDGDAVKSCTMLAVQSDGREVTTVHGLTPDDGLSDIQQAFIAEHGLQCGFCTPGMIVATHALLSTNPDPTRDEIVEGLEGNICRCTGYIGIIRAVEHVAATRRGEPPSSRAGLTHLHPISPSNGAAD